MNTTEFVRDYANAYGVAIQAADTWVRTILEYLGEQIVANDEVKLAKFGTFKHYYVPAQGYTDFQTGEWRTSKPRITIKFNMGQQMDAEMRKVPVPSEMVQNSRRKSQVPSRKRQIPPGTEEVNESGAQNTTEQDYEPGETCGGQSG